VDAQLILFLFEFLALVGLSSGDAAITVTDVKITSHSASGIFIFCHLKMLSYFLSAPVFDSIVMQLIASVSDKDKSVRSCCVDSLISLGQQQPAHVMSCICIHLQQVFLHSHLSAKYFVIRFRSNGSSYMLSTLASV
jgi:hypothetical protein